MTMFGSGRLGPREIRSKRFTVRRFGRRGFDPDEVRGFLARVAAEIIALRTELAAVREENRRMTTALYQWQQWHAGWNQRPERALAPVGSAAGRAVPNQRREYLHG